VRLKPGELKLVRAVAKCYLQMKLLPPLTAQNLDETPGARSQKWTPNAAHFVIDVRHALESILVNRPDASELVQAWVNILADGDTIRESGVTLIGLLAPVIAARGLEPWGYFRQIRRGSPERMIRRAA
jgi:hypothetical protein